MRILIDLQGAQGGNKFRGIGYYVLNLARALVQQGGHEYLIALNGAFDDTIAPIRAAFEDLLPPEKIVVWDGPNPGHGHNPNHARQQHVAELLREGFIARQRPDWVLLGSLFEDLAATSIGRCQTVRTAVLHYDLIPLAHPSLYLASSEVETWYQQKIGHLRRADMLLCISSFSAREAVQYLGIETGRLVTVGADCDERFKPAPPDPQEARRLGEVYGLKRSFLMYTGGDDWRKNLFHLVEAYAKLPAILRESHQLALVMAPRPETRAALQSLAEDLGLGKDELVLTDFVPDHDLLALYRACKLFVFPSWHEGFGLPLLEAMRCGKAALAANATSLPEIVGRKDALFDPHDVSDMTNLIQRALTDEVWRAELEHHGLEQARKFSWNDTARRVVRALESHGLQPPVPALPRLRRRLAWVSPLPPEHSGIADYSAMVLPELARWYEVEVVVSQSQIDDAWIRANCPIRSVEEFRTRVQTYDRIVYQFGNSPFHQHMFDLLEEFPGVVVLHDFFLSHVQVARQTAPDPAKVAAALYPDHGYEALYRQIGAPVDDQALWHYPANLAVLQRALAVVVHSRHARDLAAIWYGPSAGTAWAVVPLARSPASPPDRQMALKALGFDRSDLVVCAFGGIGPTKLSHRLAGAWQNSVLAGDPRAKLVFVGSAPDSGYVASVKQIAEDMGGRVRITDWVDNETFRQYLAAASIAVQLRAHSRGETSAAALDCMNYGLPTIVNAHGSLAELDPASVWMLPQDFSDAELVDAITALAADPQRRASLGNGAMQTIRSAHMPSTCMRQCTEAIEAGYRRWEEAERAMLQALAQLGPTQSELRQISTSVARNLPPEPRVRQWLVDVSGFAHKGGAGFARAARIILLNWLRRPPTGYRVEPVYASPRGDGYRYARRIALQPLDIPADWTEDAPVEAWPGDVFVGLGFAPRQTMRHRKHLSAWQNRGIRIWFVVHDLLPAMSPSEFPPEVSRIHQGWLEAICNFDGWACVSAAVAGQARNWLSACVPPGARRITVRDIQPGDDIAEELAALVTGSGRPSTDGVTPGPL